MKKLEEEFTTPIDDNEEKESEEQAKVQKEKNDAVH